MAAGLPVRQNVGLCQPLKLQVLAILLKALWPLILLVTVDQYELSIGDLHR